VVVETCAVDRVYFRGAIMRGIEARARPPESAFSTENEVAEVEVDAGRGTPAERRIVIAGGTELRGSDLQVRVSAAE
jgi:hypothetical protein